ncbi:hypothetical protein EDD96_6145 [Streptomyces sp. Ag109_G2-6]|uniref:hypothetical protein n=1 Tax=Streptomyces TaxID=1883 RepID=UPI0009A47BB1|nr:MULTISPECIES: hypothetical protein [Streptomyces]RPF29619.1 hypothetical protein EDD96_6145 [Streptomyces sp. Ag109_G2-6]
MDEDLELERLVEDDPLGAVVHQLARIERGLPAERIREVAGQVLGGPATRRRVARELRDNPQVMATGRSPSIWSVGKLLAALSKAGAQQLSAPRCCDCGCETRTPASRRGGLWACGRCSRPKERCVRCGTPRCSACPLEEDPTAELVDLVAALDPALGRAEVERALAGCSQRASVWRRVCWAVLDRPALLTGDGHLAPTPTVLAFLGALADAGGGVVKRPCCAGCGTSEYLRGRREGPWICSRCEEQRRSQECSRCGKTRRICTRDDAGPVCGQCFRNDPANREACTGCGQRRVIKSRADGGRWCHRCSPHEARQCSMCAQAARCTISRTTGAPWCRSCRSRYIRCSTCAEVAPLKGGTLAVPLCARCVNPDPGFWDRCPTCQVTWQFGTEPCQRCAVDKVAGQLLGPEGQTGHLAPLRQALVAVERPDHAMAWLSKPNVRTLLADLSRDPRPVSHEVLDALPPGKTVHHLRALLTATGLLPARDEHLAALERWVQEKTAILTDPGQRRILHGYATWHHLRRLRRRTEAAATTTAQDQNVRVHVAAAVQLLNHLTDRGLTLGSCAQGDLDDFLVHHATYPSRTANFVRWALTHRHAHDLSAPATRWQGPCGPHDEDRRWAIARRLLHEDGPAVADRVAGLFLLLYAQHANTIRLLTTARLHRDGQTLMVRFGDRPIHLPAPLDALVEELLATRRGTGLLNDPGAWLFPGRLPGQPLSADQLVARLRALGVRPRQDRATALFTLARQVPAAVLARMLGIHRQVAVQWQQAAAGDWTAYAADVATRSSGRDPGTGRRRRSLDRAAEGDRREVFPGDRLRRRVRGDVDEVDLLHPHRRVAGSHLVAQHPLDLVGAFVLGVWQDRRRG